MPNLTEGKTTEMLQIGADRNLIIGLLSSMNVLVDMTGALFFASLILVTIRHKKLHTACNFLIALYSLACLFNKTILLFPFAMRIIVGGTLPIFICAIVQIVPFAFSFNIYPLLMAISTDRMLSIFFPIWYSLRNELPYLLISYSLTWIFPLYSVFVAFSNVSSNPNFPSQCSFLDLIGDNAFLQANGAFLFNLFIFCSYSIMAIKLYFKNQVSPSTRQPLFKSLFLVISIQIFGWTSSLCVYTFLLPAISVDQRAYFVYFVNGYSSLATTAEVLAIYFTSSIHRKALKKEFACLFGLFSKGNNANQQNQQNTIHVVRRSAPNYMANSTTQQIATLN